MTLENSSAPLAALEAQFARIWAFREASGILGWDMQTMMPTGSAAARGETLAALAGAAHALLVDPRVAEWLDAAEAEGGDDASDDEARWRRANLREMRRSWIHGSSLPSDLVEALERATAAADIAWRGARAQSDFAALLPTLSEVLNLTRQAASAKGAALGLDPYDALVDQYEPGATAVQIDAWFAELSAVLPDFLEEVIARQAQEPSPPEFDVPFPDEAQRAFCSEMMAAAGFDFDRGRLDISAHPFCGGATDDVRITTRYDGSDPLKGLFGVMHETGHALYEQGRPKRWRTQPVGEARGLALHESQSLLIEMQVTRGPEFLSFAAPRMAAAFGRPANDPAFSPDALRRRAHRVARSFIRVDADEVSYPLHVILRTRLERAMIAGDLPLGDLPGAWNAGMRELLGVTPPDDRRGCLQDIHWPSGGWGYFPTYTLGAMAAAQLYEAALAAHPEIPERIAQGDFGPLVGWLREKVHGRASVAATDAILRDATGASLGTGAFLRRIKARYGAPAA